MSEWIARLSLSVVSTLVGFALAEASVRLAVTDFYECDSELGWRFSPGQQGLRFSRDLEFPHRVKINSFGYRDLERDDSREADDLRILLLGDSFVAGMQVHLEATMGQVLERSLSDSLGVPVEVLNAGTDGYGTGQQILQYSRDLKRFKADIVILGFYPINDLRDNLLELDSQYHGLAARCGRPYFGNDLKITVIPTAAQRASGDMTVDKIDRWLRDWSYLYQLLRPVPVGKGNGDLSVRQLLKPRMSEPVREAWRQTEQLIVRLRDTVESDGAIFILLFIPDKWTVNAALGRLMFPEVDAPQPIVAEQVVSLAQRNSIPLINLVPPFVDRTAEGQHKLYFDRDMHWQGEGHALAAAEVAAWLIKHEVLDSAGLQ